MTRQRTTESLADEAARWRRSYRAAQEIIAEQNRVLLTVFLQERLADPSDFELLVGMSAVLDASGRIMWRRVEVLVDELLAQKPHLAVSPPDQPFRRGRTALEWFQQQTV